MIDIMQQSKPFEHQLGRQLHSFPHTSKSPIDNLQVALLHSWWTNHKRNPFAGETRFSEESGDDEEDEDRGDHYESSEEPDSQDCSCLIKIIAVSDSVSSLNLQWFLWSTVKG